MSPTEFSNYIKQRAMQQQLHHSHGGNNTNGHLGPIGPSSPSRSLSPNPLAIGLPNDPYFFQNVGMGMYPPFTNGNGGGAGNNGGNNIGGNTGPRNMFDSPHFHHDNNMYTPGGPNKFSAYIEPNNFYNLSSGGHNNQPPNQQQQQNGHNTSCTISPPTIMQNNQNNQSTTPVSSPGSNQDNNSKLLDGLNSFYSNPGPYQHLLVAN